MTMLPKWILAEFLQKNLTDPNSRTTTAYTETFDGDGTETDFSLANSNILYVDSVTVDGTAQAKWINYDVDVTGGTITFSDDSIPATGTDNIEVTYYTGTRWIYTDKPHTSLSNSSYPRISISQVSKGSNWMCYDHGNNKGYDYHTIRFQITLWTRKDVKYSYNGYNYSNNFLLDEMSRDIQNLFKDEGHDELYEIMFNYRLLNELEADLRYDSNVWQKVLDIQLNHVEY